MHALRLVGIRTLNWTRTTTSRSSPKIDHDEFTIIAATLMQSGYVTILKILAYINDVCYLRSSFSHFSNKHRKIQPGIEVLLADIVAKGCKLGLNLLANFFVGISDDQKYYTPWINRVRPIPTNILAPTKGYTFWPSAKHFSI